MNQLQTVLSSTSMRQAIVHKAVEFADPQLNRSREIWPEDDIFGFSRDNIQPEAASGGIMTGMAVDQGDMDVCKI